MLRYGHRTTAEDTCCGGIWISPQLWQALIEAGRVKVDGQVAKLGDQADPSEQRITVDGMPVPRPQPRVYVMLNKPRG